MNEEIDDSEFYHEDFTTASSWEILVANMEEIVHQWKSDKQHEKTPSSWDIKSEKLIYMDHNFDFTLYKRTAKECSMSENKPKHVLEEYYDFTLENSNSQDALCLFDWYGLNEFIVCSTAGRIEATNNESKTKILLSALTVLVNNMNLDIPAFVQIQEKWQKVYCGVYCSNGIRTNFDIVHLKRGPHYCQNLTGLLQLFKSKICSPCSIENITVSCKLTYQLQEFENFCNVSKDIINLGSLFKLPLGLTTSPVKTLSLHAVWSCLSEHSVIDSDSQTDFVLMRAQQWHCNVEFEDNLLCLLGDCLSEYLSILNNHNTIYDILGDYATSNTPEMNPLDVLTEPAVPTISSLIGKATKFRPKRRRQRYALIPDETLVTLLYFLFPDAAESGTVPYGVQIEHLPRKYTIINNRDEELNNIKTCNQESLVWRLSLVLSLCLQNFGGLKAFCHLWYEFVQEMRYRWENGIPIPGVSNKMPDLRTCLLNQKLQLLNCCLDRKIAPETQKFASAENSEDEEFFDATDDLDEEKRKEKYSLWDKPVGRLAKFNDLKLIKTGDPLYIPCTQDPVLKTEDQLDEDADMLLKLGSDNEASELRARIMSASLLSDMESFKAANPGAILEDFIRWYSPRDWIEEEELDEYGQKKGSLSDRMKLDNNIWVEMWENSRPVPAHRQKRLFDETTEAEKVLQFLDLRTVSQIVELVIPVLSHASLERVLDEMEYFPMEIPHSQTRAISLLKHVQAISRDSKCDIKRFEIFMQEITALELQISQISFLQSTLNPENIEDEQINNMIVAFVLGRNVNIENKERSIIGARIMELFKLHTQKTFNMAPNELRDRFDQIHPVPAQKEFVLRTDCIRPNLHSCQSPQFLRAILGRNEFRLIGAFSEDTSFF
ncbi:hypothetical protein ABEB36_013239 [Hypothenemus hampei]|uniref:Rab3 GTPase-activating protein catalytic subunit n=1 Tax=Hypothenemus hampei TaxID=57062 RepID=A0ABD1E7B8_HYPHA